MLGKFVAGVIGGFIVSFFAGNVITFVGGSKGGAAAVGLIVWGVAIVAVLKSPRAAKAWRWMFGISGALSFCISAAIIVRSLSLLNTSPGAIEGIAGIAVTGCTVPIFFLLGLAFLVIAALIGRDKQVVEGRGGKR